LNAIERLREQARAALAPETWDYLEAGADAGISAATSAEAWQRLRLRPRILRGVAAADTRTELLGQPVAAPVMLAPTGRATRYHPDGERELLAGTSAAETIVLLPSSVLHSLAPLRAARPDALVWQQLYMAKDRAAMRDGLALVADQGCKAVVLTADLLPGAKVMPPPPAPAAWETARNGPSPMGAFTGASLDDLAWLCGETGLPVVVKGVLRGDDAELCLSAGAAALIVSNHGGNQLDTAISSAEALEDVVQAAGSKAEVYVDGGIRHGASILKALALGARAVLVGRPASYALAAAGAAGVEEMLQGLTAELQRTMALCGAATIADIDRSLVSPSPASA
jgi:4-hydroxymandelate oxidase